MSLPCSSFSGKLKMQDNRCNALSVSLAPAEQEEHVGNAIDICATNSVEYPAVWSEQQWLECKGKHKWLIAKTVAVFVLQ